MNCIYDFFFPLSLCDETPQSSILNCSCQGRAPAHWMGGTGPRACSFLGSVLCRLLFKNLREIFWKTKQALTQPHFPTVPRTAASLLARGNKAVPCAGSRAQRAALPQPSPHSKIMELLCKPQPSAYFAALCFDGVL